MNYRAANVKRLEYQDRNFDINNAKHTDDSPSINAYGKYDTQVKGSLNLSNDEDEFRNSNLHTSWNKAKNYQRLNLGEWSQNKAKLANTKYESKNYQPKKPKINNYQGEKFRFPAMSNLQYPLPPRSPWNSSWKSNLSSLRKTGSDPVFLTANLTQLDYAVDRFYKYEPIKEDMPLSENEANNQFDEESLFNFPGIRNRFCDDDIPTTNTGKYLRHEMFSNESQHPGKHINRVTRTPTDCHRGRKKIGTLSNIKPNKFSSSQNNVLHQFKDVASERKPKLQIDFNKYITSSTDSHGYGYRHREAGSHRLAQRASEPKLGVASQIETNGADVMIKNGTMKRWEGNQSLNKIS